MDEISNEAYQVYAAAFRQLYQLSQDEYLVFDTEVSSPLGDLGPWRQDFLKMFDQRFGIQVDQEADSQSTKLENKFALDTQVMLLSYQEQQEIKVKSGWTAFHQQYGSIFRLTRIAFDPDRKFAVFSFRQESDIVGIGRIVLLERQEGEWKIITASFETLVSWLDSDQGGK